MENRRAEILAIKHNELAESCFIIGEFSEGLEYFYHAETYAAISNNIRLLNEIDNNQQSHLLKLAEMSMKNAQRLGYEINGKNYGLIFEETTDWYNQYIKFLDKKEKDLQRKD